MLLKELKNFKCRCSLIPSYWTRLSIFYVSYNLKLQLFSHVKSPVFVCLRSFVFVKVLVIPCNIQYYSAKVVLVVEPKHIFKKKFQRFYLKSFEFRTLMLTYRELFITFLSSRRIRSSLRSSSRSSLYLLIYRYRYRQGRSPSHSIDWR